MKSSKSVSILDTLNSNSSNDIAFNNNINGTSNSSTSSTNNSPSINSANGLLPLFVTEVDIPPTAIPPTTTATTTTTSINNNNLYNKYRSPSFSSASSSGIGASIGGGGGGGGDINNKVESYMKRSKSTPFLINPPQNQSPLMISSNPYEQQQQQQQLSSKYPLRNLGEETNYNYTSTFYPNLTNYTTTNNNNSNNPNNHVNTITTTTTTTNYQPSSSFLPFNISTFNNNNGISNNNNNNNGGNNVIPSPPTFIHTNKFNSMNNIYKMSTETKEEIIQRLETQIQNIMNEVDQLKNRVKEMEEEQGRMRWGLKYSRRVLITSNFLLGIWVSISRVVMYISKQKKMKLLHVVTIGVPESRKRLVLLLLEAISNAARKSWIFFLSSFLLSRNTPWKRHAALVACTTYSLYLAFFPQYLPWTNYFNVFASLLYITAAWSSSNSNRLKDIFKNL